jgi:hypothetical protein
MKHQISMDGTESWIHAGIEQARAFQRQMLMGQASFDGDGTFYVQWPTLFTGLEGVWVTTRPAAMNLPFIVVPVGQNPYLVNGLDSMFPVYN